MKHLSTLFIVFSFLLFVAPAQAQIPSTPSFNFNVNFAGTSGVNIGWTNGDGMGRIVVVRPAQPVNIDISTFNAAGAFSNNYTDVTTTFDVDHKRIYQGTNSSVSINNLQPGAVYHVAIYEYNQWPTPQFNPTPLRGFFTTLPSSGLAIGGFLPFTFCLEETVSLPFLYSGAFDPGNSVIAQLSDSTGDFTNAQNIGSIATLSGSGAVQAQIPAGIPASTDYRFRIISTSPADTSAPYPIDIEIIALDQPIITTNTGGITSCAVPLTLQTDTGFSYQWFINGNAIATATNATFQADSTGYYQVQISSSSVSCTNTSDSIFIQIHPLPQIDFQLPATVCLNDSVLSLSATPSGGVFTGTGVQGSTLLFDSAGIGSHAISYYYTDPITSCTDTVVQTIQIVSNPTITFTFSDTLFVTDPALLLSATPPGGTFSGTGVVNDTLTPFAAGLGTHYITYSVVDSNTCASTDSVLVTILAPVQTVVAPTLDTLCTDQNSLVLPGSGSWNGPGVFGNVFYIDSTSGVGAYWLNYTEMLVPGYTETDSTQLFVVANPTDTFNFTLCFGDSAVVNGQSFFGTATQQITANNPMGCDSVLVINTVELPQVTDSLSFSICAGDSLVFAGQVLNTAGVYPFTSTAASGCDSTTYVSLNVDPIPVANISLSICSGDSILIGANYYSTTGVFQEVINRPGTCDSIVNLNLTIDVNSSITTTITDTICSGNNFTIGGQQFNQTGLYNVTLQSTTGCDSVVDLDLFVLPAFRDTTAQTICTGDSVLFLGNYYNTAGTYTVSDTASNGCDSINILQLTLTPRPAQPVIVQNNVIPHLEVIPANGDFYEWYRDGNLLTDTTAIIVNPSGGMYSVIMYQNGCPSLPSILVSYSGLSTEGLGAPSIQIAPNPSQGFLRIDGLNGAAQTLQVTDFTGRLVHLVRIDELETIELDLHHLAKGSYTLQLIWTDGSRSHRKVILH